MTEQELIKDFCLFCNKNPKFRKVQRMMKFGTRDDAFFNIQITLISLLKDYMNGIQRPMGYGKYLDTRAALEKKIPEFAQNILNSFKNI